MQKYLIGSVSSGSLRTEDIIENVLWYVRNTKAPNVAIPSDIVKEAQDFLDALQADEVSEDTETDSSEFLNDTLIPALDEISPPYFYFGSHPGDGADFGFWLCEDWRTMARENDTPVVSDDSQLPEDFSGGDWFQVSDHGNLTLNVREKGIDSEIWSIV